MHHVPTHSPAYAETPFELNRHIYLYIARHATKQRNDRHIVVLKFNKTRDTKARFEKKNQEKKYTMKHRDDMTEYTDHAARKTTRTKLENQIHRAFGTRARARVCIQTNRRGMLCQRPTYSYDDSPDPSLPRQQQQKTMEVTRRPRRKAPPNVRPATSHDMKMVPVGVCVNGKR
jgi:hypothetical protein